MDKFGEEVLLLNIEQNKNTLHQNWKFSIKVNIILSPYLLIYVISGF